MSTLRSLHVVILAAGKGTRMKSSLPKVMHPIGGKPMIAHVIDQALSLSPKKISVVVGHGAEQVKGFFENSPFPESVQLSWVEQTEQLGTGHAVKQVLPHVDAGEMVLVLYGDVPLTKPSTLVALLDETSADASGRDEAAVGMLTVSLDNPHGYGRIVRKNGSIVGIVEQKDASKAELLIKEVNTGIMAIPGNVLLTGLPKLSNDNAQGEYYLTDMVAYAVQQGVAVTAAHPDNELEVEGVNDKVQLSKLERYYQRSLAEALMRSGATLADPSRIDIRGTLASEGDVFIDANVTFIGKVTLGPGVQIGPNCVIKDAEIGAGTVILSHSVIESAVLGQKCNIGPFARIRPGTELSDEVKVGNFVETKKAVVGHQSKINHLSYIGDAEIGVGVNVGAGTITCNYDGVNKHKTTLADGVFIGSNSSLVAPVTVGKNATIGAGTTLTKDAPAEQLTLARAKQATVSSWKRPEKKT